MSNVKKSNGTRIAFKVDGIERTTIPVKAIVFIEEKEEIKILSEMDIKKEESELNLGLGAEDLPNESKLAIVPKDVEAKSYIRRLVETDHAPSATIRRDLVLAKEGKLTAEDLPLKPIDDVVGIWPFKHQVCGRVIKRDPVTGEECPVPGATVRVLDVDFHLWWWYPYPGLPWCWIYPLFPRREEIATIKTDECGHFCVDIPYFDIDAILRWRLRFRCLWETLQRPTVIDAIDLGIKPDIQAYPELEHLPELEFKPKSKPWPDPGPLMSTKSIRESLAEISADVKSARVSGTTSRKVHISEQVSDFYTKPQFESVRQAIFDKQTLFETVDPNKLSVLDRPAFPDQIAPPNLPDDDTLLKILPDKKMLTELRRIRPIARLLRCWPEFIPDWHLYLDVPDIVFKVEQDIDNDGTLETIYDQGYLDINWNLSEPTTDVVIEAWPNAICVPCGPGYQPCTETGIVGISEMPVDLAYLDSHGYALRVNRPKPNGVRTDAQTPFCKTLRLVGCPNYGTAAYYKVFYRYESDPESHFKELWYEYNISAGTPHHVVPDDQGFYPVLTPPNNYFPYHTLINWRTHNYPNGKYNVRLALYDAAHNPIGAAPPSINMVLDNSKPSIMDFLSLRYNDGTGWQNASLLCPIIPRPTGKDIELEVRFNVAATHLRDIYISFTGCDGVIGSCSYWHKDVGDNNKVLTWKVTMPLNKHQGGYRFYLEGRSRAFDSVGGLASNWDFDPLDIWRGKNLHVVILDS
jgi:hypothetical protein